MSVDSEMSATTDDPEEDSNSSQFSDDEEEEDQRVNEQGGQTGIVWTGYNKKTPVLVFAADSIKTKRPDLKSIGEKYHLAYKMVRTECRLVRNILHGHGFHESHPNSSDFNLTWTGSHLKPYTLQSMQEYQKINHFPRSYELTRKDRLFKNVQRMQHMKGTKHFDFIPPSFVIPTEFQDFCSTYLKDKGPWIVKPIASSRGRGIFLINHPEQVPLDEQVIVCRYVNNPLLIDGFKFDIRLYVAVTSYDPLVIYLYEEGLARFATVRYEKANKTLKNQCMHLTNYSVNKKSGDFVQNDDPDVEDYGNKWSMGAMLRYLRSEGYDTTALMMRIEDVIVKTIISVELPIATACKMFMPHRGNCFELYGFDVLVDSSLRPWILEVNLSPSLACDAPLDLKIKSNMVSDLFSLTGFMCHDPMVRKMQQSRRNEDFASRNPARTQKQRPSSASSHRAESATNKKLVGLTGEEIKILRRVREEYQRRGGFVRIFPTADSWDIYSNFLQFTTTNNMMLHQRLYPDRHKNQPTKTSSTGYSTSVSKLKSVHLHSAPSSTISATLEGEEILTYAMRRSLCYERVLRKTRKRVRKRPTSSVNRQNRVSSSQQKKIKVTNGYQDDEEEAESDEESEKMKRSTSMFSTKKPPVSHGTAITLHATDPKSRAAEGSMPVSSMLVQNTTKVGESKQPDETNDSADSIDSKVSSTSSMSLKLTSSGQRPPSAGQRPQTTGQDEKPPSTGEREPSSGQTGQPRPLSANKSRGVVIQGVIEPPKYIIPHSDPPAPPPIPSKPKSPPPLPDVVALLHKGHTLSKVQARSAFAMYLSRVQGRLQSQSGSNDVDDFDTASDQMDLVLRFLRRAAVNLMKPFKVIVPSRKLPLNDRRRILAKQLGDFIHIYSKETDQLKAKPKTEQKSGKQSVNSSSIFEDEFNQFVNRASESDLEDVLTTYTKMNKSASIFLGGSSNKSQFDTSQSSAITVKPHDYQVPITNEDNRWITGDEALDCHGNKGSASNKSSYPGAVAIYSTKMTPVARQRPASASTARPGLTRVYGRPLSASSSRPSSGRPSSASRQPGPKTFDEYNEDAINDALQRLAVRQQARTYSSASISANMLHNASPAMSQETSRPYSTAAVYNTQNHSDAVPRQSVDPSRRPTVTVTDRGRTVSLDRPITIHSERYSRTQQPRVNSASSVSTHSSMTSGSSYADKEKVADRPPPKPLPNGIVVNHVYDTDIKAKASVQYVPASSSGLNGNLENRSVSKQTGQTSYPQGGAANHTDSKGLVRKSKSLQNTTTRVSGVQGSASSVMVTQGKTKDYGNYNTYVGVGDCVDQDYDDSSKKVHQRPKTSVEDVKPDRHLAPSHAKSANVSRKYSDSHQPMTANETFNNFIDDVQPGTTWQNDLLVAYNQVTGSSPQSNYVASKDAQYTQQQSRKQQALMEASKRLLQSSKAKHQAMIAHAHAVQKSNEAALRIAQTKTENQQQQKFVPQPPTEPAENKKPVSSHRLARTTLAEEGVYGNRFYSSLKYDTHVGITKVQPGT